MKQHLILFLSLLVTITAQSQNENWGKKGDQWHYTWTEEYWPSKERPLPYKHTTLTVVNTGKNIKNSICNMYAVENGDSCNPLLDSFYCYTKERVTYYFNKDSNAFYPLYDFNLVPGDSLITQTNVGLLITYLDSLGSIEVDDTMLTVQYVHYEGTGLVDHPDRLFTFFPKNQIYNIEGIGNTLSFFPWWDGFCHNIRVINLRCFTGQDFEYHYGPEWVNHCDSTFMWGENSVAKRRKTELKVFPNPAKDKITISDLERAEGQIEVYSLNGQLIHSQPKLDGFTSAKVSITQFEKGLYLLVFRNKVSVSTSMVLIED